MPRERQEGEENIEELLIRTQISAFTGLPFNHRQIPKELARCQELGRENYRKPTQTYPGTEERIQIYMRRSELNLPIFNHLDKKVNHGFENDPEVS